MKWNARVGEVSDISYMLNVAKRRKKGLDSYCFVPPSVLRMVAS